MEMIGLGRGEHDAVDAWREQARPQAVRSGPEAVEDLGHGAFEVGDRRLAAVQRGEHVDQHDLPVEPREMIAEEGPHYVGLIGLVAPLHHGEERAARKTLLALRVERREGERGRAFKIARHEEASWRQRRQRVSVGAGVAQIGFEQIGKSLRQHLVGRCRRIDLGEGRVPILRRRLPACRAALLERGPRPLGIVEPEQRQVEQPFARIVDDIDVEPRTP